MENEKKVDEQPIKNAPEIITSDMPPKESAPVIPEVSQDNELIKKVEELTDITSKLSEAYKIAETDKENYKKGMLSAKKKLKEYGIEDEVADDSEKLKKEDIAQMIAEGIKNALPEMIKPKDDILNLANNKISELTIALKNRNQVNNSISAGGNLDKTEPKDLSSKGYWSPEQIADLKKRGLDPDKVFNNIPKAGGTAGAPQI